MRKGEECTGLVKEIDRCRHGFPTSAACYGLGVRPFCMNETLCGRLFKDTGGKPILCPLPERRPGGA